ncbi:MAG: hypothetical protein FJW94_09160 [Actinobacteria bacterium]|nr:hypothetical protein [Actinomycetota bacterium]
MNDASAHRLARRARTRQREDDLLRHLSSIADINNESPTHIAFNHAIANAVIEGNSDPMPTKKTRTMTTEHKAAIAAGRTESRAVKNYLEALERNRPKRGRKRTPDSINKRLSTIDSQLATADVVKRLALVQERLDLLAELDRLGDQEDISVAEAEFVEVAAAYSERKGISYSAWREIGVSAAVLKAAGVSRSS